MWQSTTRGRQTGRGIRNFMTRRQKLKEATTINRVEAQGKFAAEAVAGGEAGQVKREEKSFQVRQWDENTVVNNTPLTDCSRSS